MIASEGNKRVIGQRFSSDRTLERLFAVAEPGLPGATPNYDRTPPMAVLYLLLA